MADRIWTDEDIATLKAAIASGASSVSFSSNGNSRAQTFQSLAEMKALLSEMLAEKNGRVGYTLAKTRKGFVRGC